MEDACDLVRLPPLQRWADDVSPRTYGYESRGLTDAYLMCAVTLYGDSVTRNGGSLVSVVDGDRPVSITVHLFLAAYLAKDAEETIGTVIEQHADGGTVEALGERSWLDFQDFATYAENETDVGFVFMCWTTTFTSRSTFASGATVRIGRCRPICGLPPFTLLGMR